MTQEMQYKVKDWPLTQMWGADQTKNRYVQPAHAKKLNSSLRILVNQPVAGCM